MCFPMFQMTLTTPPSAPNPEGPETNRSRANSGSLPISYWEETERIWKKDPRKDDLESHLSQVLYLLVSEDSSLMHCSCDTLGKYPNRRVRCFLLKSGSVLARRSVRSFTHPQDLQNFLTGTLILTPTPSSVPQFRTRMEYHRLPQIEPLR